MWDAGGGVDIRLPRALVSGLAYVDDRLLPGTYRYWVIAEGAGGASDPAYAVVRVPFQ